MYRIKTALTTDPLHGIHFLLCKYIANDLEASKWRLKHFFVFKCAALHQVLVS